MHLPPVFSAVEANSRAKLDHRVAADAGEFFLPGRRVRRASDRRNLAGYSPGSPRGDAVLRHEQVVDGSDTPIRPSAVSTYFTGTPRWNVRLLAESVNAIERVRHRGFQEG